MDNQDYVIDGERAFSSAYEAFLWYRAEYHKLKTENEGLKQALTQQIKPRDL